MYGAWQTRHEPLSISAMLAVSRISDLREKFGARRGPKTWILYKNPVPVFRSFDFPKAINQRRRKKYAHGISRGYRPLGLASFDPPSPSGVPGRSRPELLYAFGSGEGRGPYRPEFVVREAEGGEATLKVPGGAAHSFDQRLSKLKVGAPGHVRADDLR